MLLCEGNGMRSISRITGVSTNTICKLMIDCQSKIDKINDEVINGRAYENIEADEIRTYVSSKGRTSACGNIGVQWVYIGICRDTRVVIDYHVGRRDAFDAGRFLGKIYDRLLDKTCISTDCLLSYISAINKTKDDGGDWDLQNKIDLKRSSFFGKTLGRSITNRIESHNGVVRQHCSRLIRKTRCYSKRKDMLRYHLKMFFFYYNFIKKHKTIKKSPIEQLGFVYDSDVLLSKILSP